MKFIRKKFQEFQNFDNKGLSLVELICSIAILSLICMAVSGVMIVSADSYNRGNAETKVQQEAQLVANQIDDLLIDATADVSFDATAKILTIRQGANEYQIVYNSTTLELNYVEGSTTQLMASGVTKFDVDVTDFEKLGYIKLDMEFVRKSQNYPAVFTITARNKDTTAATEIMAAIYLPNEIVLEPNETYTFNPSTSGLTNTSLVWTLVGNTDSKTVISGTTVKVGKDETAFKFKVRVSSVETGPNGAPKAQKFVDVYVRRVNGISISASLLSGNNYRGGAVYQLDATALGFNLEQRPGTDYDSNYVDPYQMSWEIVSGDITLTPNAYDSTLANVTLNSSLSPGSSVTVKAIAKHPAGTNKTGIPYATVEQVWTLMAPNEGPIDWNDGGWLGQTNASQGTVNGQMQALKDSLGQGMVHRIQFRFREYPDGEWPKNAAGEEIWINNSPSFGGDSDNSQAINLRPLTTGTLDYYKDYHVQIRVIIVDNSNTRVWPILPEDQAANPSLMPTDPASYLFESIMVRTRARFDSDINTLNFSGADRLEEAVAPTIRASLHQPFKLMELRNIEGVDLAGNSVTNSINYILEKKQPDGTWKVITSDQQGKPQSGKDCQITFRNDDFPGSYRIRAYVANQPNKKFNSDYTAIVNDNPATIDVKLYNEETGEGFYYFNVTR